MADFQAFDTFEEMMNYMRVNEEAANGHLADAQKAVTYEDYWCRFYDIESRTVIFGYVMPLSYWDDKVANAEPGEDRDEWEFERDAIQDSHGRGYMYGRAYSILEPEGEYGSTHQANLWPISKALYEQAEAAEWRMDDLPEAGKAALQSVYSAWRAHQLSLRDG